MEPRRIVIILSMVFGICGASLAISEKDSLKNVIANPPHDTSKVKALNTLYEELIRKDPDSAIVVAQKALNLAEKVSLNGAEGWPSGIAKARHHLGGFHSRRDNYAKALKHYQKALKIHRTHNVKKDTAATLGNIGIVYQKQGHYPKALKYYFRALKIARELDKKKGVAKHLGNIGIVYYEQGDYPKALEYYFKALKKNKALGRKKGVAINLGNIGMVYKEQGNYSKSLEYYQKALEKRRALGNKRGIAINLSNIGLVLKEQGNYSEALEYYLQALQKGRALGAKIGVALILGNIGELFTSVYKGKDSVRDAFIEAHFPGQADQILLDTAAACQKTSLKIRKAIGAKESITYSYTGLGHIQKVKANYSGAIRHYHRAYQLAESLDGLPQQKTAAGGLYEVYKTIGNSDSALFWHERFNTHQDSLFNKEKQKEIGKLEAEHEIAMQQLKRKQREKERQRKLRQQRERRNQLQYSGILISLVIIFGGIQFMGRMNMPVRLVEGLVFFMFLIFFEFLLVLSDPYVEGWTNNAPAWKLLINGGMAAIIFPLHSFFENTMKKRLFGNIPNGDSGNGNKGGGSLKTFFLIIGLTGILMLNTGFDSKTDSLQKAIETPK